MPGTELAVLCCDLHSRTCEPPSELCCAECSEADHPRHPPGVPCILDPQPEEGPVTMYLRFYPSGAAYVAPLGTYLLDKRPAGADPARACCSTISAASPRSPTSGRD